MGQTDSLATSVEKVGTARMLVLRLVGQGCFISLLTSEGKSLCIAAEPLEFDFLKVTPQSLFCD